MEMTKMKRFSVLAAIVASAAWPAATAMADPAATPPVETPPTEVSPVEAPTEETPAKEAPATETPTEETPTTEAPAGETPAEETPATETPTAETSPTETPVAGTGPLPAPAIEGATPNQVLADGTVVGEKSMWATGLHGPQGMARDARGNVYVAEYEGGQIAKFAPDGSLLDRIGTDLKNPAWIERAGAMLYVTERTANRLLQLNADGTLSPVMGTIEEPLGLAADLMGRLIVVSRAASQILVLPPGDRLAPPGPDAPEDDAAVQPFVPLYVAPNIEGKHYDYRCVAVDQDGTLFFTDETEGQLMLRTPAGRVAVWTKDLNDPAAVVVSPDGGVFVAEEGAGRVSRVNAEGTATVVADGLGQPCDIEFLDGKTMLVSDRHGGVIWKVTLP
jgi:SMP-30/Gluconolactonase/LRE-like region